MANYKFSNNFLLTCATLLIVAAHAIAFGITPPLKINR
jgi:hypothetical protein